MIHSLVISESANQRTPKGSQRPRRGPAIGESLCDHTLYILNKAPGTKLNPQE